MPVEVSELQCTSCVRDDAGSAVGRTFRQLQKLSGRREFWMMADQGVVSIGEQLGCHLGERVEVAVEHRASQAGTRHYVPDGQRGERPVEEQLPRGAEDPTSGFV